MSLLTATRPAPVASTLIDDLIGATAGTCDLDYRVWQLLGHQHGMRRPLPAYTQSIDAALSALPAGWTRAVDASAPEQGIDVQLYPAGEGEVIRVSHDVEAIATVIAVLVALQRGKA